MNGHRLDRLAEYQREAVVIRKAMRALRYSQREPGQRLHPVEYRNFQAQIANNILKAYLAKEQA